MTVLRIWRIQREWRERQRARSGILLLDLSLCFFVCLGGLFCEGFRVQLPREFFDGGDDARRGAVDGVADYCVTAITDGVDNLPTRKRGELFHLSGSVPGLRLRENEKIRL